MLRPLTADLPLLDVIVIEGAGDGTRASLAEPRDSERLVTCKWSLVVLAFSGSSIVEVGIGVLGLGDGEGFFFGEAVIGD